MMTLIIGGYHELPSRGTTNTCSAAPSSPGKEDG